MLPYLLPKSIKFSSLVACVSLAFIVPSHAELSINPYPLSGASHASPVMPSHGAGSSHRFEANHAPLSVLESQNHYEQPQAVLPHDGDHSGEWSTFRGADLREVLEAWSRAQNVEVIWNLPDRYSVKETISVRGSYEEAVGMLLAQYNDFYVRPVASLHVSSNGQGKALVVFNYEGG